MKVTTVKFFCDMCGAEMANNPDKAIVNVVEKKFGYGGGSMHPSIAHRVTIEFFQDGKVEYQQSQLCIECKKEILKGALKILGGKNEP